MRKAIAAVGLVSALTFGGATMVQATSADDAVAQTDATTDEDDGGDAGLWGLLGLLGLAGLAGLKRREPNRNYNRTEGSTVSHR